MRNTKIIIALILVALASFVLAQPIPDTPEPMVSKDVRKIDSKTLEITKTTVETIRHDKATLETELVKITADNEEHIRQIASNNERAAEINEMLKVFK